MKCSRTLVVLSFLLFIGCTQSALDEYDKAIRLEPNNSAGYFNRGIMYFNLGQYQRAIQDYSQAIRLDPNKPGAYNNRANAYSSLGQYAESLKDLDEAIRIDPNLGIGYYNRGWTYVALGQYQEAGRDAAKAEHLGVDTTKLRARLEEIAAYTVDATALFNDYKSNELAAEQEYKGHEIEVTGVATKFQRDIVTGTPQLLFPMDKFDFSGVEANFPNDQASRLAQLTPGQRVTVRCMVDRFAIITVILKECSIVVP